ncbi:MAG: S26 family signal peptidase [Deltaproteobacteria bacterium]|nr:S26 family signal peptidase [Deltaproteobacteria bacterium]
MYYVLATRLPRMLATALAVSILLAVVGASHFIGFNSSPSAARVGFYWRTAPRPGRGKLVEFCLPEDVAVFAEARGYIGHGACPGDSESLGKVVTGMPGDVVTVDPAAALKSDTAGRPIGHFPFGQYRVPPGELWVHGTARNSFDSRYFGPIPIANIRASLEPLLTW